MRNSRRLAKLVFIASIGVAGQQSAAPKYMTAADILKLPSKSAVAQLAYGSDPLEFGELRLPEGSGPFPVAVVIHGGCYQKRFLDLRVMDSFSTELTAQGMATWNIEYRKIDDPGGAWPGMFRDIGAGVDYLREIAPKYRLDLNKVVVVGHSAGGHLAVWTAARQKIPKTSPVWVAAPIKVRGVVDLDGQADLEWIVKRDGMVCGSRVIDGLVGTGPEVTENLRATSAFPMLPLGVREALVYRSVPNPWSTPEEFVKYASDVKRAGDAVLTSSIDNVGHFEFIAPGSTAWPQVIRAVKWALE